jgi:hypothetical protein
VEGTPRRDLGEIDNKRTRSIGIQQQKLVSTLLTKIISRFRYIEYQFNALRRAKNRNQVNEYLRILPYNLDETYERILYSINDEYIKDVRRVLTLLYFSTQPLTVNKLIDAHTINLNKPP